MLIAVVDQNLKVQFEVVHDPQEARYFCNATNQCTAHKSAYVWPDDKEPGNKYSDAVEKAYPESWYLGRKSAGQSTITAVL